MMKLFIFIAAAAYLAQVSLAAPISDEKVEQLRTIMGGYIDVEPELAERIVTTFNKYPSISKVTSLALQGDTCTENKIDVMEVIAFANNNSDEEMNGNLDRDEITTIENFTEDELKLVEIGLKKRHSSEKVRNAMNILRGFQKLASRAEVSAALLNIFTIAAEADRFGCQSENSLTSLD